MDQGINLLIVADMPVAADWQFLSAFESPQWDVKCIWADVRTRKLSGRAAKLMYGWPSYLKLTVRAARMRNEYDVILCWQGIVGVLLGAYKRLTGGRWPRLAAMGIIHTQRRQRLYAVLRRSLLSFGIKGLDRIFCYSRGEVDRYSADFGVPSENIRFLPVGLDTTWLGWRGSRSKIEGVPRPYVFSGGRSNRDYGLLVRAMSGLEANCVIVASASNNIPAPLPRNVRLFREQYDATFFHLMQDSELVVLPLADPQVSSGQLVLLQAMALRKPIIVTGGAGVIDYVVPGKTAVVVRPGDVEALRAAIRTVREDRTLAESLASSAEAEFWRHYTLERMSKSVASALCS